MYQFSDSRGPAPGGIVPQGVTAEMARFSEEKPAWFRVETTLGFCLHEIAGRFSGRGNIRHYPGRGA